MLATIELTISGVAQVLLWISDYLRYIQRF